MSNSYKKAFKVKAVQKNKYDNPKGVNDYKRQFNKNIIEEEVELWKELKKDSELQNNE